jgi:hypothetical protein
MEKLPRFHIHTRVDENVLLHENVEWRSTLSMNELYSVHLELCRSEVQGNNWIERNSNTNLANFSLRAYTKDFTDPKSLIEDKKIYTSGGYYFFEEDKLCVLALKRTDVTVQGKLLNAKLEKIVKSIDVGSFSDVIKKLKLLIFNLSGRKY